MDIFTCLNWEIFVQIFLRHYMREKSQCIAVLVKAGRNFCAGEIFTINVQIPKVQKLPGWENLHDC